MNALSKQFISEATTSIEKRARVFSKGHAFRTSAMKTWRGAVVAA
jgi:hypothetical protein